MIPKSDIVDINALLCSELGEAVIPDDDGLCTLSMPDGRQVVVDVGSLSRLVDLYRATGGQDIQANGFAARLMQEIDALTADMPNRIRH